MASTSDTPRSAANTTTTSSATNSDKTKPNSKLPKNARFTQQKLPAWQPVMSANTIIPILFAVGIAFIPLGIGFLISSLNVQEKIVDYTSSDCESGSGEFSRNDTDQPWNISCQFTVNFTLNEGFRKNVYMYYSLSNFYQNHRRYIKSVDLPQLEGKSSQCTDTTTSADPYKEFNSSLIYAPCGAIANSMFNDILTLTYIGNGTPIPVPLINTGIAWKTDKNYKYKNPPGHNLSLAFSNTLKPINWSRSVYELDPGNPDNNGYANEDLMVWMRTAALPTFRKLYRRINHTDVFSEGLPAGNYSLGVIYNYPVLKFKGTKRMILSNTSFLGGKNPFLGIAYIVVGAICVITGFIFLIIHIKVGKRKSELREEQINRKTPYYDRRQEKSTHL